MKKTVIASWLFAWAVSAPGHACWDSIRHSALLPGGDVTIRVESQSGAGIENYILYAGSGILEKRMTSISDGPATLEATVPGSITQTRYYGFRFAQAEQSDLMPVYIAADTSPLPRDLTRLAADPVGDHCFGDANLDLVDCRVGFSESRFFAALTNAGGGFPVSQGLTFFGYVLAIANPALAAPDTVFALIDVCNLPGIITPGLYKITGPGLGNLSKIGQVTVQPFPDVHTVVLSCDLADLMADAYFRSWFDPSDQVIAVAGLTQRITLFGGVKEADRTPGVRCHLRVFSISPAPNLLPGLAGLSIEGTGSEAYAQLDYFDPDGHCPVLAEITFDEKTQYTLHPRQLAYQAPITYRTATGIDPLRRGSWRHAVARFSDNLCDTVAVEVDAAGTIDVAPDSAPAIFQATASANQFELGVSVEIETMVAGQFRVAVFDEKGSLVRTIFSGELDVGMTRLSWGGCDDRGLSCPVGNYFCWICASGHVVMHKICLPAR